VGLSKPRLLMSGLKPSVEHLVGELLVVKTSTLMWCSAAWLRPRTTATMSLSVVVAAAVVDTGTIVREPPLR
jgi:hypothetical protein